RSCNLFIGIETEHACIAQTPHFLGHVLCTNRFARILQYIKMMASGNIQNHRHFRGAAEGMGAAQLDTLPVVSPADVHKLEGIVTLQDVLDSYGVGRQESD